MSKQLYCYGTPVGVTVTATKKPVTVYADVYPSTPYFRFKRDGRSLKYWLLGIINRKWSEPHIRWWVEVYSDLDIGTHHIDHDNGAITYRRAMIKASLAIEKIVDEIEADDPVSDLVSYDSVTNTVVLKSAQSDPKRKTNT